MITRQNIGKRFTCVIELVLVSVSLISSRQVLVAVDLGLRSGFAFYTSAGRLIDFTCERFPSTAALPEFINDRLVSWEGKYKVSNVVLEGDALLRKIWTDAVTDYSKSTSLNIEVTPVSPSEWREALLIKKERQSGKLAKTAAREISRQIMWRSEIVDTYYDRPINTDAAEAILIGYYAVHCRRLFIPAGSESQSQGLTDMGSEASSSSRMILPSSKPLVERYCNGNVVLPPRAQSLTRSTHRNI
jgi:hypothetical protein